MKPLNLAHLASAAKAIPDAADPKQHLALFQDARKVLSGDNAQLKFSDILALCSFVRACIQHGIAYEDLSNFYTFYHLPNISREFDLFKLGSQSIINIELKSQPTDEQKMKNQLQTNKYYLGSVGSQPVESFTFIAGGKLYTLDGDDFCECKWDRLANSLRHIKTIIETPLESLFHPSRYLVSPVNDKEAFFSDEYYLTEHQAQIKHKMIDYFSEGENAGFVIKGGAGTGKTLLLYDMAKTMATNSAGQMSCIIHCGTKSPIHDCFNNGQSIIKLIHAKDVKSTDLQRFCFIGVDEAHRIFNNTLSTILEQLNQADIPYAVTADEKQTLSHTEERRNIVGLLETIIPDDRFFILRNSIRSNDAICSFVSAFFDSSRKRKRPIETGAIIPVYASNYVEAVNLLKSFVSEGYQSISLSPSLFNKSQLDLYTVPETISAHQSIGQEFEKVVIVVPNIFSLDCGKLKDAVSHPNPDYISSKLLYEGMTRARSKLAVIFDSCPELYSHALSLLF